MRWRSVRWLFVFVAVFWTVNVWLARDLPSQSIQSQSPISPHFSQSSQFPQSQSSQLSAHSTSLQTPFINFGNISLKYELVKHVVHIAKEYGPARIGGLGGVVTALAKYQSLNMTVSVVMPAYSYLLEQYEGQAEVVATLSVDAWIDMGYTWLLSPHRALVQGKVWKIRDPVTPTITIYLVGAGDLFPYNRAFLAKQASETFHPAWFLDYHLRDLWFCSMSSKFVALMNKDIKPVNVVHVHGATVALFLPFFRSFLPPDSSSPGLVYTLHDYSDEFLVQSPKRFVSEFIPEHKLRCPGTKLEEEDDLYLSVYGICHADLVTCVSNTLPAQMLSGKLSIINWHHVAPFIHTKARLNRFVGIGNGLDLSSPINPFTNPALRSHSLNFEPSDLFDVHSYSCLTQKKEQAKQFLVSEGLLTQQQGRQRVVLFIGRFQYNKGMEAVEEAFPLFQKQGFVFILMGHYTNYDNFPYFSVKLLGWKGMVLIDNQELQKRYGVFIRLAADIVFVPSKTEAFGLVAAESLLFGAVVVSTGVGGLQDFLVDGLTSSSSPSTMFSSATNQQNAFFFSLYNSSSLEAAVTSAVQLFRCKEEELAITVAQFVQCGLNLDWNNGPVQQYMRLYWHSKQLLVSN
eukprot:Lithocolla_globosa_v1_NODE_2197_length_2114_cov_4.329772.p1 type:complete len:628 gc:universal NODE_2197_length_2114_cov_4.329772:192-2075(+)